jgi:hypothetical protein
MGSGAGTGSGSGAGRGSGATAGAGSGAGGSSGATAGAGSGAGATTTTGTDVMAWTGIAAGRATRSTGLPARRTAGCASNAARAASRGIGSVVRAPIGRLGAETGGGEDRTGAAQDASAATAIAEAIARETAVARALIERLRSA